jgi:hypothetical protein
MHRTADAVAGALGLSEVPEVWRQTWPQSAAPFAPGAVFLLREDWVREACSALRVSPEVTKALAQCAAAVRESPALQRLAWHLHWLLCLSGLDPRTSDWPRLDDDQPAGPMLYGLIVLSGWPRLREIHMARGLDLDDTIDTMSDLDTWTRDWNAWEGGYRFTALGWMRHHLRGDLLKLGRMEYLPGSYHHEFRWYRQAGSGKLVALAEDGLLFRGDGQFASADGGEAREGLWRSRFVEAPGSVSGNPVTPWGQALPEPVTLDTHGWHEVLRRGDPVVTVHIPSRGRMDPEACGASFVRAVEVYRRHYPDVPYRAFTCQSWLLDPQFDQLDPAPPNICAFMREWYLHPAEGAEEEQTWERVFSLFGHRPVDWGSAPQDTSLRRALVAFARQGGHMRGGGGVIFPEDLDWGRQAYRTVRRAGGL